MSIKNIPDLKTEKNTAITIAGIPAPVESLDHNTLLENSYDSLVPRLEEIAIDNLADNDIVFTQAGSRGTILISMVADFQLDSFSQTVKRDTIFLVVSNDFDFTFGPAFTVNNSIVIGRFDQSSSGVPNIIRVTIRNDQASADFTVFEFLNNKLIDDFKVEAQASTTFTDGVEPDIELLNPFNAIVRTSSFSASGESKQVNSTVSFRLANPTGSLTEELTLEIRIQRTDTPGALIIANSFELEVPSLSTGTDTFTYSSPPVQLKDGESVDISFFIQMLTSPNGGSVFVGEIEFRDTEIIQIIPIIP